MKCKGCTGGIEYVPLAQVKELNARDYHNAGPALTHTLPHCDWFENTPAMQIIAYINVAEYKASHGITANNRSAT